MDLSALPWGTLTPSGLLLVAVMLVLTGRLVPRSTLTDVQKERDEWKKAAEDRSAQLDTLLPSLDVTTRMIEAAVRASRDEAEG